MLMENALETPFEMPSHEDFPTGYEGVFACRGSAESKLYRIEPGNGTSYRVLVTKVGPGQVSGLDSEGGYVVSFLSPGFATLALQSDGCLSVSYVAEKTGTTWSDATAIRNFLCQLLGHFAV
jgi:hypothetical protein